MVDISIIIPVYNSSLYLEECIGSLYRQGIGNDLFEVLLIDDGSTDNSLSIAKKLSFKHGNIKIFQQENQGQAVARNLGLEKAKGKYLAFVDSDDYLLDNGIRNLYDAVLDFDLDIVFGYWHEEDKDGNIERKNSKSFAPNTVFAGEELVLKYPVFGSVCGGLYKRDIFKTLRFEKGIAHEDSELCFRLFPFVNKVMLIDQSVYFYRYNPSSTDRDKSHIKLIRNIESDAIISSKILHYISFGMFNEVICKKYKRIANSMVLSYFAQLRKYKLVNRQNFKDKVAEWRNMGVYPFNGTCNSFCSTVAAYFFNIPFVLKKYLCN